MLEEPEHVSARLAVLVCHPHPLYGGTLHNKVVYRIARGLRHAGAAVLRFNFRGVGRSEGAHGHLAGEIEDARTALEWLRRHYRDLPFALAGFSFGAQVITRLGCATADAQWLLAAGFPTSHGPFDYLLACRMRKIFVQGTHDQFGPRADLEALFARLPEPKQLVWIESTDHFFAGGLNELEEAVHGVAG